MTNKVLHIPEEIRKFREKTLIFSFGHYLALPFYVHGREMAELPLIHTEDTDFKYSDREGFSHPGMGGGGSDPGTEKHNKEHYEHVFVNYFLQKLGHLEKEYEFGSVIVVLPDYMKHVVREKWPKHLVDKTEFIGGNFHNHPPMDILHKIMKEKPLLFETEVPM